MSGARVKGQAVGVDKQDIDIYRGSGDSIAVARLEVMSATGHAEGLMKVM